MIIISSELVLSPVFALSANNPVIGYDNRVTVANISATSEAAGFPASNMANNSTFLRWAAEDGSPLGTEVISVAVATADLLNYVGIARHNLGSQQYSILIEGNTDADASPETWVELVQEFIPADDSPIIARFDDTALAAIRITLTPGLDTLEPPTISVLYVGALLVLERRLYVGHTPITYGRSSRIVSGRSEVGNFLGRITLSESLSTQVALQNLTPAWYRTYFHPFVLAAQESPFFFAWRPEDYPTEVGFAWLNAEPVPKNQRPNGMMQVSFDMTGIAQ
jgi:hypothetical protein